MEANRLVKKTGLYFIGNFSSKIISAAILPIYAFFVTPAALGTFDYAQIWGNVFAPVCFVAIWEAILKFTISETDSIILNKKISSILFIIFSGIVVSAFVFLILFFFKLVSNLVLVFLMMLIIGLAQIWQYFARSLHYNKIYVIASILGTFVNFALLILLVCIFRTNLYGLVVSYLLGQGIIILFIESKCHILKYFSVKNVDFSFIKSAVKYSAPLVLNLTSLWILNGFGRTIINDKLGAEANGLYTFALKFGTLLSMFGSVVSMAMCEEVILKINDKDIGEFFSNTNTFLFNLFLSMAVLIMPAINVFYSIIGKTDYYISLVWVPLFILNAVFCIMSTNIGTVFPATGKTNLTFITTVLGAIITVVLSYALINNYEIMGVAIAQIAGSFVMLATRWIYAKKLLCAKIKAKLILVQLLLFIIIASFSFRFNVIKNILLFLFVLMIMCIIYKTYIVGFINKIKIKLLNSTEKG